jgi:CubicO group peptidase (beta-lactamase class C family)
MFNTFMLINLYPMKKLSTLYVRGLILTISLFLFSCTNQKEPKIYTYDSFLSEVYSRGQFNGNVLVVESGKIVFNGVFGFNGDDNNSELDENSVFRLASVGKQFTSMGIMILKERGKLSLDQDIRDFLPELSYKGISIRNLLNHVSGLPDYVELMDTHWKPELNFNDPERLISGNSDILQAFADYKPKIEFSPGDKWEYSNTGYVFLALIIERASGQSFAQFLKENIFDPAAMENTRVYYYQAGKDESFKNRVFSYEIMADSSVNRSVDCHYLNRAQGDGGTFSTTEDLAKWDRILYTENLISRKALEEAFTPVVLNNGDIKEYGFGWGIKTSPGGGKVVDHSGGWAGFRTNIYREIDEDNCIIILSNNSNRYMWPISNQLVNILHGLEVEIPAFED